MTLGRRISRTIQLADDFASYEGMVTVLAVGDLSSSSSRYNKVRLLDVEGTKDYVTSAMQVFEAEDRSTGLYTPASLLEYPKFSGKDAQFYFNFEEKIRRCLKFNKVPQID